MSNKEVVLNFEEQFKNRENLNIVDDVMSPDFVHHLTIPGIPAGPDGVKAVGQFVFGQISDIRVKVEYILAEDNLVSNRITAEGKLKATNEAITWSEHNLYRFENGKIVEWWDEGGPALG